MRARDIMTRPVITVHAGTSVRQAAALLTRHGITAMPVLDTEDRLVGMVSESDLLRNRLPHDPRSHLRRDLAAPAPDPPGTVAEVMTRPVVSMSDNADAADLAELMLDYDVRSVPIVAGATVVGIVSRRDLLRTLVRDDDLIEEQVRHRLTEYTGDAWTWVMHCDRGTVSIDGDFPDEAARRVVTILAATVPGVTDTHVRHLHPCGTG